MLFDCFFGISDRSQRYVARRLFVHVGNADEYPDEMEILEVVRVPGVVAHADRQMHGGAGRILELLEFARAHLDALDAAAGDAMNDLIANGMLVLGVLLARTKDGLENANLLGAVRLS